MSQSQIAAAETTPFGGEEDVEFQEEEWPEEAVSGSMIGRVSQTLAIFEFVVALLPGRRPISPLHCVWKLPVC